MSSKEEDNTLKYNSYISLKGGRISEKPFPWGGEQYKGDSLHGDAASPSSIQYLMSEAGAIQTRRREVEGGGRRIRKKKKDERREKRKEWKEKKERKEVSKEEEF